MINFVLETFNDDSIPQEWFVVILLEYRREGLVKIKTSPAM
jgi:hypothetical protein